MDSDWDDKTAIWYLERYGDHRLNHLWMDHVSLSPSDFLLDIGCGGGASIKAALPILTDGRATGVDPIAHMISVARENLPGVDFYQAGAEAIPMPGSVVDVALANCSISHWTDLQTGLSEVFRVLKPGGQFIALEEAFAAQENEGRLKSPNDLKAVFEGAGFKVSDHGHHDKDGESYWATLAAKPI